MGDRRLNKKETGYLGECLAVSYLEDAGLKILIRNYRCPKGEIDIIAKDGEWLVFIEVRSRTSDFRGTPEESLGFKKVQRFKNTLSYYLLEQGYEQWPLIRADLVAIHLMGEKHAINWIKGIM
jgi:putative endonuclease